MHTRTGADTFKTWQQIGLIITAAGKISLHFLSSHVRGLVIDHAIFLHNPKLTSSPCKHKLIT